jgi:thiamine kinase-like enzyme
VTDEAPLSGGYVNAVVRVGATVRRQLRTPRPFVHDLLRTLEHEGWSGAPRFLGIDEQGREILSWIDGHVPWSGVSEPPSVYDAHAVAGVARLVRELHDLTAGSPLAGDGDVVCHNDLSLKNTVYREVSEAGGVAWRPVAFIDWDAAAPGRRIHDVAHLAWQWAANTSSAPESAARLVRVAADAYGLEPADRAELVDTILWWQDRCWRGIQADIDAGAESVRRLRDAGAVGAVRADYEWTVRHRAVLDAGLVPGVE